MYTSLLLIIERANDREREIERRDKERSLSPVPHITGRTDLFPLLKRSSIDRRLRRLSSLDLLPISSDLLQKVIWLAKVQGLWIQSSRPGSATHEWRNRKFKMKRKRSDDETHVSKYQRRGFGMFFFIFIRDWICFSETGTRKCLRRLKIWFYLRGEYWTWDL